MKLKILVASHKPYALPASDIYLPVEVGAASRSDLGLGGVRDCEGENISRKNPNYCELTALYWAWKNLPKDVTHVGLVHYRRHFGKAKRGEPFLNGVFKEEDFSSLLHRTPVIVPPKRNYWIETVESQYIHAHHREDIDTLKAVIGERHPAFLPDLTAVLNGKKTHIYNMFVMERALFNEYCAWLFDILFCVESRLDIRSYNANDARVFGFLSERLLDVWLNHRQIPYTEAPLIFSEKTNWLIKGSKFLARKIFR